MDDDSAVRDALSALLRVAGFNVDLFASAEAFLSSAPLLGLGCLVLDVRMPGMSGLELQEQLASSGAPLPIVFITAHADASLRARALAAGAVDFLQKPFSDDALLAAIGRATAAAP